MINKSFFFVRKIIYRFIPKALINKLYSKLPKYLKVRIFKLNSFFYDKNSGHGEFLIVRELLNKIDSNKFYVDIGASDGFSSSCTFPFAKDKSYSGVSIELDEEKFIKLKFLYKNFTNVKTLQNKVTPKNVEKIFIDSEVPKNFSFLNIDIDSYDLEVLENLLICNYKPDVISIEINEKIPPPIVFEVLFDEQHFWNGDHFYGCSISAASKKIKPFGYKLYKISYNNAIFINKLKFLTTNDKSDKEAYEDGYLNKNDRKELFSYNSDFEKIFKLSNEEQINFVNKKFKKYKGMYSLYFES